MHTNEFDEILEIPVGNADYPPDSSQRDVIKAINNTVVAAGAGSGKTEVLATRFAYLLMTDPDLHVGNILAITFTKKAASEIYERVFKKLKDFSETLSNKIYEGKYIGENKPVNLAKRALSEFSDAKIQTLDSYSNDIVRLAVARYGIKPDFSIGSGDTDSRNFAKNFVLANLENKKYSEAFRTYAKVGKIEKFAKDYICDPVLSYSSIATPDGWFSKNFEKQTDKIIEAWNNFFSQKNENSINPANIISKFKELYDEKKDSIYAKLDIPYSETIYFQGIESFIQKSKSISPEKISISKTDKDKIKKICSESKKVVDWMTSLPSGNAQGYVTELRKKVKDSTGDYFEKSINKIHAIKSFAENYEASRQMFELMDLFLCEINSKKKRDGLLSFTDIQELALKTLREQKDILKQQQSQIKKIMIDEFQDNNLKNKELLDLLAGDSTEKLFFVGDEKQSIYKFRGADVSVFNGLKNSLKGHEGGKVLYEMNNNYRSDKELLKAFNELFGDNERGICDDSTVIPSLFHFDNYLNIPDYEATYLKKNYATKPDDNGNDLVESTEIKGNVRIHACILHNGKNSDGVEKFSDFKNTYKILDDHETEAYFIATKIKELGPPYSQYAILDKSRTHRNKIQKYLTLLGIPFSVDVQKNIFAEGIVNDFYNLLRICIYPNDKNAFFSFLTSPFVNLSPEAAQNIMAEFSEEKFEAFSETLDLENIRLSKDEKARYEKAKSFYGEEKFSLLSSSITKSIERLWYDTGYFYETQLNENTKIYAEQFDLLYQIATDAENQGKNIGWFIDQLSVIKSIETQNLQNVDEAELETDDVHYPLEKNDSVTIMTIHQSKGLEFNTVFVSGTFSGPKTDKLGSVYFDDDAEAESTGISLSSPDRRNFFYEGNKELSKNKALAEEKRLIYVAITRAKKEVYILGSLSESEDLKKKKENASCSIMHRLLRYYYISDKGLYQDNDFSEKALDDSKISEEPYYNETGNAPFDFIKLNPVSVKVRRQELQSAAEQKKILTKNMESIFFNGKEENKPVEFPPETREKTSSPSALEKLEHDTFDKPLEKRKQNVMYEELNSFFTKDDSEDSEEVMEESAAAKKFDRASFGTMAHAYLENWVKSGTVFQLNFSAVNTQLSKCLDENFNEQRKNSLHKICSLMTENFASSSLGKLAKEAKDSNRICKAENNFKMMLGDILFTGSVDLFFEKTDGTFVLADYKTDEKIKPEKYFEQQYCYKESIEKIYGIKVSECWLYYLRYDYALEITDEVEKFSEEKLKEKFAKGPAAEDTF